MKRNVQLKFVFAALCVGMMALGNLQAQSGFSYQAVARNASGQALTSQDITVRFGIRLGSLTGELVWGEEHQTRTNALGLFDLVVGDPGAQNQTGSADSFDAIDWSADTHYLQIELKTDGDFVDLGGSAIQMVPMAQYANTAKQAKNNFTVQPTEESLPGEALFEVKRSDGQPVFAVYEDMVWVYDDPAQTKAAKGGFAVGGYNRTKGVTQEYMRITSDSVRIYIDANPDSKAAKGGFAVGGYNRTKAETDEIYHHISGSSSVEKVADASRILWYPRKEAFLAGNIHVGSVDSVGQNSTAMGFRSIAMGDYSQAFGYRALATGDFSTSFGNKSIASGEDSYAFGSGALASGDRAFALGVSSSASGYSSVAFGTTSKATKNYATAVGYRAEAQGLYSSAFGLGSIAYGDRAMAMGMWSTASQLRSLALGYYSNSSGPYAMAIGPNALASGDTAISLGSSAEAAGPNSVAIGTGTFANDKFATAIGYNSRADGFKALSVGTYYVKSLIFIPIIIIPPIFGKGEPNLADPFYEKPLDSPKGSFVSLPLTADRDNQAIGSYSIAVGDGNYSDNGGIALGVFNDATSLYATAVGFGNQAAAAYSFAGGFANRTDGEYSTAFGRYTSAASLNSFAIGTYNVSTGTSNDWIATDPLFQIGNGTGTDLSEQHDALRVNKNGQTYINGSNAYAGLFVTNYTNSDLGYSYVYGIRSGIYRNKTGSTYYSGYFYDIGTQGTYMGLFADLITAYDINVDRINGSAADVSEYIYDSEGNTSPGDVIVADKNRDISVLLSTKPYQTEVLGVVTTNPLLTMGMELITDEETGEPLPNVKAARLALTGRVPVKISEENGPIEPGDLLTTSSIPGRAMKWTLLDLNEAGTFEELKSMMAENERRRNAVIGKAVSSSSEGDGTVMVLISLQ
ncbi:MAG: hypothetical protein R2751_10980 [Bacteroidales bacterium]